MLSINFLLAQTTWEIVPAQSDIQFEIPHLSTYTVTGYVQEFRGTATSEGDNFQNAVLNATIDASSITTENLEGDKNLRKDDFFNTDTYQYIYFKSNRCIKNEDGSFEISGDLTIKNITHPVTLHADYQGILLINDQKKAIFTATGKINRFDYNLKWDDVLDNGGLIVGEDVALLLKITLLQR